MNDPNWFIEYGDRVKDIAPAFFGALFSFGWMDKTTPLASRWFMVGVGFAAAVYGTPAAVEWFSFKPAMTGMVGFALGLFSMSLIDAIFTTIKSGKLFDAVRARLGL